MKKSLGTKMKVWALGALTVITGSTFTGCTDEIAEENRFTFTGELIADHLKNNPEYYSDFCVVLEKAKISKKAGSVLTTLSTYGAYTCFAPTNEAIQSYIQEKYNEYLASLEEQKLNPNVKLKDAVTSPLVKDLSDSMATVIAKNHLIEKPIQIGNRTEDGQLEEKTMNRRYIDYMLDDDGRMLAKVAEDYIEIVNPDNKTENGYVHRISGMLIPSDLKVSEQIKSQTGFDLFSKALELTGFAEVLKRQEIDPDYEEEFGNRRCETKFDTEQEYPGYPATKNYGYTLLVETDELLANPDNNSFGIAITDIDSLEWFAAQWYGKNLDYEKKTFDEKGNYTDPENPLYKFISYHIVDRTLRYKGDACGGFIMENYWTLDGAGVALKSEFNSEENLGNVEYEGTEVHDRYDYFETAYPYSCLKVTKPMKTGAATQHMRYGDVASTLSKEIVLNYTQDITRCKEYMKKHVNVVVEDDATTKRRPGLQKFNGSAANGNIFTIDKILIYNEDEMRDNILNERMRWDIISLFPELTNNGVRWSRKSAAKDEDNTTGVMYFIPERFCERINHINPDTKMFYLKPFNTQLGQYSSYQGDELLVIGKYDFEYRIPHVPSGTYEVRIGFSTASDRGVLQIYFDGQICGIPLDMRMTDQNLEIMGWKPENLSNEEENRENDKAMRNREFMKAPASIYGEGTVDEKTGVWNLRHAKNALRRVLGTFDLVNGKDYKIRIKDVTDAAAGKQYQFNQDYLEIVPNSIAKNPDLEDIY